MSKKKAIICTIMFAIVLIGVAIAMFFIKPHNSEVGLFFIFSPAIVGHWLGERIENFYYWLRKND